MRAPSYVEAFPKGTAAAAEDAIFAEATIADPHPLYAQLRDMAPIARVGDSGVHTVSTWSLIEEALGREEDFSANLTGMLYRDAEGEPAAFDLGSTGATDVIATADEPRHSVHRLALQPRLDARQIARMEAALRDWTRTSLEPWLASGGGDVIPMAERIPALAVARLLGLPEDDVSRLRVWAMMGGDILAGEVDGERLGFLARETAEMANYLGLHLDRAADIARAERDNPDAPLLQILARAVEAERISRQEAIGISIVLFGAGGESTAALLGSSLRWLAEDPVLADQLRGDPELIPRFVEEIVRLESPFNFHYRLVRRPCTLGGFDLAPGDRLMLLWASANRDGTIFDDPETLRLDRRFPKRHMGFGRGLHFCIGAPLARLEARVLIEELLGATSQITPAAPDENEGQSHARYARSIFVRRLEWLNLQAGPKIAP